MPDEKTQGQAPAPETVPKKVNRWARAWEAISHAGMAELVVRLGTHALMIALILFVAWGLREFYQLAQVVNYPGGLSGISGPAPTVTPNPMPVSLPGLSGQDEIDDGIRRQARLHTDAPSRGRMAVQVYTVKPGDTLFGIAANFDLQPETVLWANQETLGDNPHNLRPGQALNILPIDGTYHRWSAGEGLFSVASFFNVQAEEIVNFSGNNLDAATIGDWSDPNIEPGTWLVVPGGRREFVNWSAPDIPRDNPEVARVLGEGACEAIVDGLVGSGAFVWPADNHFLSGFDYNPSANHAGIDIDGEEGDPIYAADSGVVVYSGWNDWGYGNMLVISHGNGWQTVYAHLSALYVTCSQSVWQGNVIGAIGSTGNASGSHLHFEMMIDGAKVNPWDYLP